MEERRVLVVEDDASLAAGLVRGLKQAGFQVELASSGRDVVRNVLARRAETRGSARDSNHEAHGSAPEPNQEARASTRERNYYDVIVLDLMLPEQSGLAILEQLQHRNAPPVIVLTARSELHDRLQSFALGAADYLSKPFFIEELLARIRARLAPDGGEPRRVVQIAGLELDLDARALAVDGEPVRLTRTEFDLLAYLCARPGRAVSRAQLAEHVLPSADESEQRTVDAHVARVRKKIGAAGKLIESVWGIGYRLRVEPAP